jgi:hypothetical protein
LVLPLAIRAVISRGFAAGIGARRAGSLYSLRVLFPTTRGADSGIADEFIETATQRFYRIPQGFQRNIARRRSMNGSMKY